MPYILNRKKGDSTRARAQCLLQRTMVSNRHAGAKGYGDGYGVSYTSKAKAKGIRIES